MRKRVDDAIVQILRAEDPTKFGLRKVGRWKDVFSYKIGRQFRLLYAVRFEANVVELLDVGTQRVSIDFALKTLNFDPLLHAKNEYTVK